MTDAEYRKALSTIFKNQFKFQEKVGIDLDTTDFEEKKSIAEGFLLMLMKEVVEVSKTLPSHFNKFEKNPPVYNRHRYLSELADVVLVAINLVLLEQVSSYEFLEILQEVQQNNFAKLEDKQNASST